MQRIKRAKITHITLCPKGKNRFRTLWKEDGAEQSQELKTLSKLDEEEGIIYGIVYAPEDPDADGHVANCAVIKEMAHEFLRDHRNVDVRHDGNALPVDEAFVAESFIVAKGDTRFDDLTVDGRKVDTEGAWAVGVKVDAEKHKDKFRSGAWSGLSMFGDGLLEPVRKGEDEDLEDRIYNRIRTLLGKETEDIDMNKDELQAILKEFREGLVAELKPESANDDNDQTSASGDSGDEGNAKDENVFAEPAPTAPKDLTDAKAIVGFQKELNAWQLRKEIHEAQTSGDFAKVQTLLAKAAESAEDGPTDEEVGIVKEDSDEVRELKRKLHKAQSVSAQPVVKAPATDEPQAFNLSKEEADEAAVVRAELNSLYGWPEPAKN